MTSGWVFDIGRFTLHDGRGLRSTLFLKGCSQHCPWCHNPEGMVPGQRLLHTFNRCIGCGTCLESCPHAALSRDGAAAAILVSDQRCTRCGRCVEACPTAALGFDAREITSGQAVEELLEDRVFFDVSSGGVTLSGGEPLMQAAFAAEVLDGCRRQGVDTALETSLAASLESVQAVAGLADELFVNLKIADGPQHHELLGWPLESIRANLEYVVGLPAVVVVRVPLIPGFTATDSNLTGIGLLVAGLRRQPTVELMNFNPLAESKYRRLARTWPFPRGAVGYSPSERAGFRRVLERAGVRRVMDGHEEPA